jgi:DNA-binding transcriptional ArsR family regulator
MAKDSSAVLVALADPTREQIVRLLLQGEKSVGEIADRLPVSRPAVSKHLRLLEGAGLVRFRSFATRNLYSVDPAALQSLRDELNRMWEQALSRYALIADNAPRGREAGKAARRVRR